MSKINRTSIFVLVLSFGHQKNKTKNQKPSRDQKSHTTSTTTSTTTNIWCVMCLWERKMWKRWTKKKKKKKAEKEEVFIALLLYRWKITEIWLIWGLKEMEGYSPMSSHHHHHRPSRRRRLFSILSLFLLPTHSLASFCCLVFSLGRATSSSYSILL